MKISPSSLQKTTYHGKDVTNGCNSLHTGLKQSASRVLNGSGDDGKKRFTKVLFYKSTNSFLRCSSEWAVITILGETPSTNKGKHYLSVVGDDENVLGTGEIPSAGDRNDYTTSRRMMTQMTGHCREHTVVTSACITSNWIHENVIRGSFVWRREREKAVTLVKLEWLQHARAVMERTVKRI